MASVLLPLQGMELLASPFRLWILTLMASVLLGCSGVNEGRSSRATGDLSGAVGGGGPGTGGQSGFQEKCTDGSSAVGFVHDNGEAGSSFQERVKGFVSATLDPQALGQVSGTPGAATGIDLRVKIAKSSMHSASLPESRIQLTIYDSYVGQVDGSGRQVLPYPVTISQATTGVLDSTRQQFNITFADSYGSVTLNGWWNNKEMRGTISYRNTRHVNGSAPASGVLGSFALPTCGVFY